MSTSLIQADSTMAQTEEEQVDNTVSRIESLNTEISLNLPQCENVIALWELSSQLENEAAVNTAKRGMCYLMLKNQLPKGDFLNGLAERGIQSRTAQLSMKVAKTLMDLPKSKQLAFSQLSGSKLIELAKLDAEVLNELDDDDIAEFGSMTVRDMRNEIKQLRGDNQQIQTDRASALQRIEQLKEEQNENFSTKYPPIVQECRVESIAMGEQLTIASEKLNAMVLSLMELQPDLEDFEHKTAASALYHQSMSAFQTLSQTINRIQNHWGNEITGDENMPHYNDEELEAAYAMRDRLVKGFNDKKAEREAQRIAFFSRG